MKETSNSSNNHNEDVDMKSLFFLLFSGLFVWRLSEKTTTTTNMRNRIVADGQFPGIHTHTHTLIWIQCITRNANLICQNEMNRNECEYCIIHFCVCAVVVVVVIGVFSLLLSFFCCPVCACNLVFFFVRLSFNLAKFLGFVYTIFFFVNRMSDNVSRILFTVIRRRCRFTSRRLLLLTFFFRFAAVVVVVVVFGGSSQLYVYSIVIIIVVAAHAISRDREIIYWHLAS